MATTMAALFVCVAFAFFAVGSSVPMQQQSTQEDVAAASAGGLGTVLWAVLDDCFGGGDDSTEPAAVCLKSKALTALDRALAKPSVAIVDGIALSARSGKSLADPQTEKADRAALDAAKDSDRKSALLDNMIANRLDQLMSTRTIVLEESGIQEGRGKKKQKKAMQQAMMMAGMVAAGVMGPMMMSTIAMIAGKALLLSKIALVLSGITVIKKLMSQQQQGGGGHEAEAPPSHHWGRNMQFNEAQDMAFSGQKQ